MTRAFSTMIWGIALLLAALVLTRDEPSIPWALTAAGVLPTIAGLVMLVRESDAADKAKDKAKAAEKVAKWADTHPHP